MARGEGVGPAFSKIEVGPSRGDILRHFSCAEHMRAVRWSAAVTVAVTAICGPRSSAARPARMRARDFCSSRSATVVARAPVPFFTDGRTQFFVFLPIRTIRAFQTAARITEIFCGNRRSSCWQQVDPGGYSRLCQSRAGSMWRFRALARRSLR